MEILGKYEKSTKSPLKSVTIKLPHEQVEAIREYGINLGALMRDMLDESDLMQKYRKEHDIDTESASINTEDIDVESAFSEELFKFEYEGVRYYYLNSTTMFEKHPDGTVEKIKKGYYYKFNTLQKESSDA